MRSRRRWEGLQRALWVVPIVFCLAGAPVARAADEWRARWRAALGLHEQAKYDKACALLRSVSKEQPKNAEVWADLASCEKQRKGARSALALQAVRMSIRWGDERSRENGYLALGAAGQRLALPSGGCAPLSSPPEAACQRKVIVCTKGWTIDGSAYSTYGQVAFFGRTRAQAEAQGEGFDPRVEGAFTNALSLSDHTDEMCGAACGRAAQAGAAEYSPSECVANCQANARPAGPDCSVVYADACRDYIGVVCIKKNKDGSERSEASEWGIPEPD